ncbi:MAG: carboxypeptidase-like regulatory domain-containing protein, partial [Anaerolineae bacterium]
MPTHKPYAHYIVILALALLLVAVGQLGGGQAAWAGNGLFQGGTIPTPTPVKGGGGGGGGGGEDSKSTGAESQIAGTVTDLSTGKAGAGITVRVNQVDVTTDSFGDYSLSGLAAGEYQVSLVLAGDAVPAQEPVTVTVDGVNRVIVNLDYYSVPPPGGVTLKQVKPVTSGGNKGNAQADAAQAAGASPTAEQAQPPPTATASEAAAAQPAQASTAQATATPQSKQAAATAVPATA